MLQVSELYIYPIKSLGGIKLDTAMVTDRGFEHDRRWMLVDDNNRFISQREYPAMALLKPSLTNDHLVVTNTSNNTLINIPFTPVKKDLIRVRVWDDLCNAQLVSDEVDNWFSEALNLNVRLVYMPENTFRPIDPDYAPEDSITSFSDGFPFLLIGQASLDDLNTRLSIPLPINRFRPNIVFTGGKPYEEDIIDGFSIGGIVFNGVKLCARCVMITIDQDNASGSKEPTKTLASYRAKNKKIYFGQNLIHTGTGSISVGDELDVLTIHTEERFFI